MVMQAGSRSSTNKSNVTIFQHVSCSAKQISTERENQDCVIISNALQTAVPYSRLQ